MNIQLFGNDKMSIAEQTPATTNSIASNKPGIPTTSNILEGYISNSWNGGIIKPIAYKKIMAGEKITNYSISGIIRMLTPKVPVAQKLTTTLKIFFVPNSRVWANHEKYLSQKGGKSMTKVLTKPAFQANTFVTSINNPANSELTPITDTTIWRDSYTSSYIPRLYTGTTGLPVNRPMPPMSALLIRGFPVIYNDMLRHKVYDAAMTEYNTDTVTSQEFSERMPYDSSTSLQTNISKFVKRGRRKDSYYTNYRTESEGQNNTISPMYTDLMEHNEWQKRIAQSVSSANDEQKNDWDIVAQIRGAIPISDGKVQFLGMKEIGMNYQQVAQTTYNNGENINTDQQVLGATGAFSYTEFRVSLINYHQFKEDGYIHVIAQTSADTVYETGIDRNELNIQWDSEYRPDFKELKEDTINSRESNTVTAENTTIGFKRKYSENFKLPNVINGDMTSTPIYDVSASSAILTSRIPTKPEFQFFETADTLQFNENTQLYTPKDRWKDYTDVLINKNLAVRESIQIGDNVLWVRGANQMFMIANTSCITNLPIDETIKNDFRKWGEQ